MSEETSEKIEEIVEIEKAVTAEERGVEIKKKNVGKRLLIIFLSLTIFAGSVLGFLQLGASAQKGKLAHWVPDYAKVDIEPLLYKAERTDEEYDVLYQQTGLTKMGIDDLIGRGAYSRILEIQDCYFTDYKVNTVEFEPFTYSQKIDGFTKLCILQEGDIIISSSIFLSWFRYGHAAIVVNGQMETVVDAVSIGKNSSLSSAGQFKSYAQFMVLRPKISQELRKQTAEYAKEHLIDLPYMLTVGIFTPKNYENLIGTHCSHLVWYAYRQIGLDLDSTGGMVVTPRDIANSNELALVQNFGFDPQKLWE